MRSRFTAASAAVNTFVADDDSCRSGPSSVSETAIGGGRVWLPSLLKRKWLMQTYSLYSGYGV
jgi:hypothetical protein